MANLNNSINMQIFAALKVAEKVKTTCPLLLIGNPGVGKTKTVELFAEVRGYDLVLLRGNSESHESILGYPIAPTDTSKDRSTIRLRPDWFQTILDNEANGKRSLLFLDEITTALDLVQAALLHLVFERKVGTEALPESTLIVAAGNYANNLSNSMVMLPPLLNRFCIYNIVPRISDLDSFLCKYEGSLSGNKINYFDKLKTAMIEIDAQEAEVPTDKFNKIGEYVERQIKLVTKQLMSAGEKVLDPAITELSTIYSDLEGDETLPGFITFRSLNYLREVTIASYVCFGKAGITSDNYKNMVYGLVGLALSRNKNTGDIIKTKVASEYYDSMAQIINDIEKMNNNRLPEYEEFFNKVFVNDSTVLTGPELNAVINKLKELRADKGLKDIERPIDQALAQRIGNCLVKSSQKIVKYKIDPSADIDKACPVTVEQYAGDVAYWNLISDTVTEFSAIIEDPARNYSPEIKSSLENIQSKLRKALFKIKTIRKLLEKSDPAIVESTVEIRSFN